MIGAKGTLVEEKKRRQNTRKIWAKKQTTNKLQTFSKIVKSSNLTNSKNIVRMRLEDMLGVER